MASRGGGNGPAVVIEHLDPVIASSNRFHDVGPYISIVYAEDPQKWGNILPWEFPQAASREIEEAFLREWFDEREIHIQGGARGSGAGFRFLKQVWYTIAIWNANERIPAIANYWWHKESNRDIIEDNTMLDYICESNAKPEAFFDAKEMEMLGQKVLTLVVGHIQGLARSAKAKKIIATPRPELLKVPKRAQLTQPGTNSASSQPMQPQDSGICQPVADKISGADMGVLDKPSQHEKPDRVQQHAPKPPQPPAFAQSSQICHPGDMVTLQHQPRPHPGEFLHQPTSNTRPPSSHMSWSAAPPMPPGILLHMGTNQTGFLGNGNINNPINIMEHAAPRGRESMRGRVRSRGSHNHGRHFSSADYENHDSRFTPQAYAASGPNSFPTHMLQPGPSVQILPHSALFGYSPMLSTLPIESNSSMATQNSAHDMGSSTYITRQGSHNFGPPLAEVTNQDPRVASHSSDAYAVGKNFIGLARTDVTSLVVFTNGQSITISVVEDFFRRYEFHGIRIHFVRPRSKGGPTAYVECQNHLDARRALMLNGTLHAGFTFRVEVPRRCQDPQPPLSSSNIERRGSTTMPRTTSHQSAAHPGSRHDGSWRPIDQSTGPVPHPHPNTRWVAAVPHTTTHALPHENHTQEIQPYDDHERSLVTKPVIDESDTKGKKRKAAKARYERNRAGLSRTAVGQVNIELPSGSDSEERSGSHPIPATTQIVSPIELVQPSDKAKDEQHIHQGQQEHDRLLSNPSLILSNDVHPEPEIVFKPARGGTPPRRNDSEITNPYEHPLSDHRASQISNLTTAVASTKHVEVEEHPQAASQTSQEELSGITGHQSIVNIREEPSNQAITAVVGQAPVKSIAKTPTEAAQDDAQTHKPVTVLPDVTTAMEHKDQQAVNTASQVPLPASPSIPTTPRPPAVKGSAQMPKPEKPKGPSQTESFSMFGRKAEKTKKKDSKCKGSIKGKPKEKLATSRIVSAPAASLISGLSAAAAEDESSNDLLLGHGKQRAQTMQSAARDDQKENQSFLVKHVDNGVEGKRKGGTLSTLFGLLGTTSPPNNLSTQAHGFNEAGLLTTTAVADKTHADTCQTPELETQVARKRSSKMSDTTASASTQATIEATVSAPCGLGLIDSTSPSPEGYTMCTEEATAAKLNDGDSPLTHINDNVVDPYTSDVFEPPRDDSIASTTRITMDTDDRTDSSRTLSACSEVSAQHILSSPARKLSEKLPIGEKKHLIEAPVPRNARKRRVPTNPMPKPKPAVDAQEDSNSVPASGWIGEILLGATQVSLGSRVQRSFPRSPRVAEVLRLTSKEQGNGSGSHDDDRTGLLLVVDTEEDAEPKVTVSRGSNEDARRDRDDSQWQTLRIFLPSSSPVLSADQVEPVSKIEELDDEQQED